MYNTNDINKSKNKNDKNTVPITIPATVLSDKHPVVVLEVEEVVVRTCINL